LFQDRGIHNGSSSKNWDHGNETTRQVTGPPTPVELEKNLESFPPSSAFSSSSPLQMIFYLFVINPPGLASIG
jgi:hypothetical protein